MTTQTSYPVFQNGQVLTSSQLNDAVDYLEQQDRLTRNKLIGIGIVCGLDVAYEQQQNRIRITGGCALTSEGYLISLQECLLTQVRDYTLPIPSVEEAPDDVIDEARYPFFFDNRGDQTQLWELLPADHTPGPSELNPTPISAAFLADKVVLLYLECNLESLRNCDVNDCSDKGAEMKFTLRKLLITRTDAQKLLDAEHEIAGRPVDRHKHPRYDLKEVRVEKINPSAKEIDNYAELLFRILGIFGSTVPKLVTQLKDSYNAFDYMLSDMYPPTSFQGGPFGDDEYFANVAGDLGKNIFLGQYLYGYLYDVAQSYNEFLAAACRIEAECCPNPDRFPKHVLLGIPDAQPTAFGFDFAGPGDGATFNPLTANNGLAPSEKPDPFRHHFIPSELHDGAAARIDKVRSLHYRTYLLAYRYDTDSLLLKDIRLTPSKDGDVELSEKAVPFYYNFNASDDLHRNWSFDKTTKNRLNEVISHALIDASDHPLKYKSDDKNLYRIEGAIGKPLGKVMSELIAQKRELGLSFAIEPVYIGLSMKDDASSKALDDQARAQAAQALRKILLCRMRDLDVIFLVLMAAMFYYLFLIIRLLSDTSTGQIAGLAGFETQPAAAAAADPGAIDTGLFRRLPRTVLRTPVELKIDRKVTESVLLRIRPTSYRKGVITEEVTAVDDPKKSIGRLYAGLKESPDSTNLFDRTREFARTLDPNIDADTAARKIYPAVSLLDQTEDLIEDVSAPSIAEFDFDRFDRKYQGFTQSFDAYIDQAQFEGDDSNPKIVNTNQALATNYGAIAATGPQTMVANLAKELQERMKKIFSELLLTGYAKRHPGMEHKAGVERGGTFVLLYTHAAFIKQVLGDNREKVGEKVNETRRKISPRARAMTMRDPRESLAAAASTADPLDTFVVLGDFCVPYLCCDTDCSDIDVAAPVRPQDPIEPVRPEEPVTPVEPVVPEDPVEPVVPVDPVEPVQPATGTVSGTVMGQIVRRGNLSAPKILTNAEVSVVNLRNNKAVRAKVRGGKYSFAAPAGKYRISVVAPRFVMQTRDVTLRAGQRKKNDFTLTTG